MDINIKDNPTSIITPTVAPPKTSPTVDRSGGKIPPQRPTAIGGEYMGSEPVNEGPVSPADLNEIIK